MGEFDNNRIREDGREAMTSSFIKDIMDKNTDTAEPEKDDSGESSVGFKAGFIIGSVLVVAGSICLEALFFMAVLSILGLPLTFLKCLAIAASVEFLSFKIKN
jgi:hypothetical protein